MDTILVSEKLTPIFKKNWPKANVAVPALPVPPQLNFWGFSLTAFAKSESVL